MFVVCLPGVEGEYRIGLAKEHKAASHCADLRSHASMEKKVDRDPAPATERFLRHGLSGTSQI